MESVKNPKIYLSWDLLFKKGGGILDYQKEDILIDI
jgi:hypothetical protein